MTTPADIGAIRERADKAQALLFEYSEMMYLDPDFCNVSDALDIARLASAADVPTLLAHVDAQAERVRTLEAALQEIADFSVFDEHGTIEYDALDESFDRLQGIAITALGDAYIDPDADALAANADAGNGGA